MDQVKKDDMKVIKFFLAALAGFGLVKLYKFVAEAELDEEENDVYDDDHDYPLFV